MIMEITRDNNDYYYYIVRINIKKYRMLKNYTAQELADLSGFTHQFIRDLECLKIIRRPRIDTLHIIADALDIDIKQLFDEVDNILV